APLGVHCSLFKNVSIQCVNLSFCVITGTLRDEGVDSVLKEKSRRLQITLKENIIADLDAVSRKYGLSKSNITAMLSNKYFKDEIGDYKNNSKKPHSAKTKDLLIRLLYQFAHQHYL